MDANRKNEITELFNNNIVYEYYECERLDRAFMYVFNLKTNYDDIWYDDPRTTYKKTLPVQNYEEALFLSQLALEDNFTEKQIDVLNIRTDHVILGYKMNNNVIEDWTAYYYYCPI